jgi:AraC-like DNA-binding protein
MGVKELPVLKELLPLFEHVPGIQFWMKDRQGRFLAANEAFIGHFRLQDFSQLKGKTDFDVSPEHLAREYVQDDQTVLASGRVQAEKMELVRESDQSLHWYATTKIPLRDGKNPPWGTAGITRRIDAQEPGYSGIRGMDDAVRHVEKNYGKPISIGSLAAMVGLSVSQFERKFKILMRESPLKFINRVRIRAACQLLLHTDLSISEVSRSTGFFDQSHFTKRFQAHLRIRPLQYRKKYGQAR